MKQLKFVLWACVLCAVLAGCAAGEGARSTGPSRRAGASPAQVDLVKDGVAKCRIVVAEDAHPALKFGAEELAKYLKKATGCGDIVVERCSGGDVEKIAQNGEATSRRFDEKGNESPAKIAQNGEATSRRFNEKGNGKRDQGNTIAATVRSDGDVASPLPIRISVLQPSTSNLQPSTSNLQPSTSELRGDGFILDVRPDGIDVIGQNPRGALYGCYEILKRYAGMRWVTPGDDGEYCVHQGTTVSVPVGRTVENPALPIRETRGDDSHEGILWHVRNNLVPHAPERDFYPRGKRSGPLSANGEFLEKTTTRGIAGSGHMLSYLMLGDNRKETAEKLYAVHPEYFPLIRGKRKLAWNPAGSDAENPCISNPELLDIMATNLIKLLSGPHANETFCEIGNNDCGIWCECEKCRALDAPEAKGTRGELSDRYWWMMNELGRRVWKVLPNAILCGSPYQNFWYAPKRVKIDPRLYCFISFNNQCWRHSVCDPKCPVNKVMCDIFNGYKAFGLPYVFNRDEIGAWDGTGAPACEFQPAESVLAKNMAEYPAIGCNGSHFCISGPFPEFSNFAKKWAPYYGKRYHWYAMWQTCYVSALTMWNPACDWRSALEEANRLYYGVAWEGGMKEFRALLTKCFFETPGCVGWGQHAPMGRCLDQPGSEEKLKALLENAVAVAKAAVSRSAAASAAQVAAAGGGARSTELVDAERTLKHVLREKEIFELTWLVQRKKYIENFKELSVYRRTGEIKVDGVLDEKDWTSADSLSDFRYTPDKVAPVKTFVRVTYDPDTLYIAVSAMEPTPEKIWAPAPGTDALHRLGDRIELFYQYPDMNAAEWHLCVNSKGECVAARMNSTTDRTEFKTAAKIATKVEKDRWNLEMAIPCSEIGQRCLDGASWKLNVGRERFLKGWDRTDGSSCCKGVYHGPANFVNIRFIPKRKGTGANDVASWRNPSFNANHKMDPRDKARYKNYTGEDDREPDGWGVLNVYGEYHRKVKAKGEGEGEGEEDWYMTLRPGYHNNVRQYFYLDDAAKVKAIFRARGKGRLHLWTCSFVLTPDKKNYNADGKTQKNFYFDLTPEWKTYSAITEKAALPTDRIAFWFCADENSEVDLDDALVTRIE